MAEILLDKCTINGKVLTNIVSSFRFEVYNNTFDAVGNTSFKVDGVYDKCVGSMVADYYKNEDILDVVIVADFSTSIYVLHGKISRDLKGRVSGTINDKLGNGIHSIAIEVSNNALIQSMSNLAFTLLDIR